MIISFAGYSQTRKSFFEVPDTATNFVYTMPVGSIIFEVDSLKFYRLTAKFTGSDNMKDVFTSGNYSTLRSSKNVFEKELTTAETNIAVGFTINSTASVFLNGDILKGSQWSGAGTTTLILALIIKQYDNFLIKQ